MNDKLIMALIGVGIFVVVVLGIVIMIGKFYRQVDQGTALIVNTMKSEPIVTFTGKVVYPVVHRAETMDISVKTITIDRRNKEGLICKDNIRADIEVTFFVRVNKKPEDVLKVAQAIGCSRASDQRVIQELFNAKFSEALKTVGKMMNFEDLYKERQTFKDKILEVIGTDLNGFHLDDCAIDFLEQTPLESLDKDNIMDAEGIRKITDLTVIQNVKTNELRQKERMEMGSQNLTADEAVFRFDQRRAEAEAKKAKEIQVAQAREQNEAQRIQEREQKETLLLRAKNEEEALVANEAKERAVLVARQNKEREVAVEQERVEEGAAAREPVPGARGRGPAHQQGQGDRGRRRRSRTSCGRASWSTRAWPRRRSASRTCASSPRRTA
ncbi:MAG: SPFH domain-containing protein [Polyangiaceae bacterium]